METFTTVQQAYEQNLLNGKYLVWTDGYTKHAHTVLSITPTPDERLYKLLLRDGNLEIVSGSDELTIMPSRSESE